MANLEIIARLKNQMSGEAQKIKEDMKGIAQATGEADIKAAAFAQRQRLLSSEMNKLAKEVAANKMSVDEANKKYQEFEKTLVKIESVAPQVSTDLKNIDKSADDSKFSFTELNQALELVEKGFQTVLTVGRAVYDAMSEGAKVEAARNTFEHLAESINTTADALNTSLRQATSGMVADAELMVGANRFVAMGLANTQEEAAKLSNIAAQLGIAFRGDAVQGMEELALMLANQSIPRLDSFGVSAGKTRERINELMATEQGMTRETAFMTAFLEQASQTIGKIGPQGDTAAAGLSRLESSVKNISDQFKAALAEGLAPAIDKIADESIPKLANSVENGLVPALIGAVEAVLPALTDAATGTIDRVTLMASTVNFNDVRSQLQDLGLSFSGINEVVGEGRAKLDLWRTSADLERDLAATEQGIRRMEIAIIGMNLGLSQTSSVVPSVANGFAQGESELDTFVKLMEQFTSDLPPAAKETQYWDMATRDASIAVVQTTQSLGLYRDAFMQVKSAQSAAAESGEEFVFNVYEMGGAVLEMDQRMRAVNRILVEHGTSLNATTVPADEYYYSTHEAAEVTYEFDESLNKVQGAIRPTAEAMAAFAAQTGKAFMEAATAGDSLGYFNENLEELGTQMVAVTTGAATNSADFELLQDAYDKAAVKLDKYRLGIEGANLSEEERAEKIAQLSEQMGSYQAQMDALGGSVTTYSERTVTATINQAAVNQALVESIAAAGGSAEQIGAAALALGTMSAAQVEAAMKAAELEIRIAGVRQAYLDGTLTADQLSGAIAQQVEIVNGMTTQMNDASGAINLVGESERTTTQSTQAMIDKFGEVPDEVTTEFVITGDYAGATQAFLDKLNSIPREVDVNVNVHGGGANTNYGAGGYQPMSSGGRVEPFKSYLVGDAPGGGITPYTEMFIPDSPGFIVNNETLQRLMGSNQGAPVAFGGGGQTSYSDSATIQIVNNFFGAVDQSSVGRLENSQRGIIEQALAERDKRLSAQSRMRS